MNELVKFVYQNLKKKKTNKKHFPILRLQTFSILKNYIADQQL